MALVDCEGLAKACQTKAVQHSAIHDVRCMHNVAGCMAMVPEYSFNIILKLYMYMRLNWAKTVCTGLLPSVDETMQRAVGENL